MSSSHRCRVLIAAAATAAAAGAGLVAVPAQAAAPSTHLVSRGASDQLGNDSSGLAAVSDTGRYVAFESFADNLVPGDGNESPDIFLRDRVTGTTTLVSATPAGDVGNGQSIDPAISATGRWVTFTSAATDLVSGDSSGIFDIMRWNRITGNVIRVSVSSAGDEGNAGSFGATISRDGSIIAFNSQASNLVAGDTNGKPDVFVRNLYTGRTSRISVSSNEHQGNGDSGGISVPVVSADGRIVAYSSNASNLVPGDTNHSIDVFVRNRYTNTTSRVSKADDGSQADMSSGLDRLSISADGRFVVFTSGAALVPSDTSSTDVYVRDRTAQSTVRVSAAPGGAEPNGGAGSASISADGSVVAFSSIATNLVPGTDANGFASDVYLRNIVDQTTIRVSVSSTGVQGNGGNLLPALSGDGQHVGFVADSTNLIPADTNGATDIFVRDLAR